jgi:hypothetical protein
MADGDVLVLRVIAPNEDTDEVIELARILGIELVDVGADDVRPVSDTGIPVRAKGGLGPVAGWLAVRFANVEILKAVLATVRRWCARTDAVVEVSIGPDTDSLKVTGANPEQLEKIIDAWLSRQASRP